MLIFSYNSLGTRVSIVRHCYTPATHFIFHTCSGLKIIKVFQNKCCNKFHVKGLRIFICHINTIIQIIPLLPPRDNCYHLLIFYCDNCKANIKFYWPNSICPMINKILISVWSYAIYAKFGPEGDPQRSTMS